MKQLMLTTALVAFGSYGIATGADAQTQTTGDAAQTSGATDQMVPAFLVSDFTGKNLYTLDTEEARALRDTRASDDVTGWDRTSMRWESSTTFAASRDAWQNVGDINDVVMSKDGEVRGVLIDVGGFLGIGARTVMVDIEELYFVSDDEAAEDIDDFFLVAAMTEGELEALPEWDEDSLRAGFAADSYDGQQAAAQHSGETIGQDGTQQPGEMATGATMGQDGDSAEAEGRVAGEVATDPAADMTAGQDTGVAAAPGTPEGYTELAGEERTADRLMGANVYDAQGENIANVDDVVMGAEGDATHLIVDVGGFLGIGSHTVAIEVDDAQIVWHDQNGDVRVQLPMTRDQLEAMPEYEG